MELWDGYDANFNHIASLVLVSDEELPIGVYHLVTNILITNGNHHYLRIEDINNKGVWQPSISGNAQLGESASTCAKRLLNNHLAIKCDKLNELGKTIINDTICVNYLYQLDISSIEYLDNKSINYTWVNKETLLSLENELLKNETIINYLTNN